MRSGNCLNKSVSGKFAATSVFAAIFTERGLEYFDKANSAPSASIPLSSVAAFELAWAEVSHEKRG
jgi:hypothetical protein